MSKFKNLSKLVRLGLAVMAVTAITVWAQVPDVIPISTLEQLQKIGVDPNFPLHWHYILANDITIESEWTPIGRWSVDQGEIPACDGPCPDIVINTLYGGAFKGTFNGNGHTIRELRINIDAAEIDMGGQPGDAVPAAILAIGLFGALDGAQISNLNIEADTVNVTGSYKIGAGILAGFSHNSNIENVRVTGTVNAISVFAYAPTGAIAGGLVGKATGGTIAKSNADVTVFSFSSSLFPSDVPVRNDDVIGGLVGVVENVSISESRAVAALGGKGILAGGLVGKNLSGTITKSSAKVFNIVGLSLLDFLNVGGLAGHVSHFNPPCPPEVACAPFPPGEITQSYSEINLTVISPYAGGSLIFSKIGGLVGNLHVGTIKDSYSIGSLAADISYNDTISLGGLVGFMENCGGYIYTSYSAVNLTPTGTRTDMQHIHIGGLVGADWCPNDVVRVHGSYWDVDVATSTSISHGGLGKTTAEMMSQGTFANWDFTNVWQIDEDESYPYLAWQGGTVSISRDITSRGINKNNLAPTATIRGKTLNVRTSSPANLQVRLIDMRGRTMVCFITEGNGGSFSLNKVSAGRYLVEMRDVSNGRRFTSSVVVR